MHTSSLRRLLTSMPPPSAGVRYGAVPCWKTGMLSKASYSSQPATSSPQARPVAASACGQGETALPPHLTHLLAVGAGLAATASATAVMGAWMSPTVNTDAVSTLATGSF